MSNTIFVRKIVLRYTSCYTMCLVQRSSRRRGLDKADENLTAFSSGHYYIWIRHVDNR